MLSFQSLADVRSQEPVIRAYLQDLMGYADAGVKPPKPDHSDLELTAELVDAMDSDPALADAFCALTPGRQRGWNLHFTTAKQAVTRTARIDRARDKIIAGKGWNER